jgi:predicted transcriptional regulator
MDIRGGFMPDIPSERTMTVDGRIGPLSRHVVLEYIKAHPGCSRSDIAGSLPIDCDYVREVVMALSVDGLAYQNQETREHFSIVDGWAR